MTGPDRNGRDGPRRQGKERAGRASPKRFYKEAKVAPAAPPGAGFVVLLDGRGVRTPGKRALLLPTHDLAQAIADEWAAQAKTIDPETLPLTKLANTAIDAVAGNELAVAADIVAYAGRDLLCYRADAPRELIERQAHAWDPLIAWAEAALGARFTVVTGVMPVEQPAETLDAFAAALGGESPFALTALHVMTTLTGSAILALAVSRERLSAAEAWAAAHVDEDWQISQWGEDAEAAARRARRWREMDAAARFVALARGTA